MFDWEILREHRAVQSTREACIKKAFDQYFNGNEFDVERLELEMMYETFRSGWIIAESFIKEQP